MVVITSHLLDSSDGTHAKGVVTQIIGYQSNGKSRIIFSGKTDSGGRIRIDILKQDLQMRESYDLIFKTGDYFRMIKDLNRSKPLVSEIIIRINLVDLEGIHHCPCIISPNGYSVWWSK